ncbi:MAG: hypothetical protein WCO06_01830 [Candidatus Roizmanbacteria bacterium]
MPNIFQKLYSVNLDKTPQFFFVIIVAVSILVFIISAIKYRSFLKGLRYSALLFIASITIFGVQSFNSINTNSMSIDASVSVVPRMVKVLQTGIDSVEISWETDKPTIQYITYESPGRNEKIALDVKSSKETTNHTIVIRNLEKAILYTYIIHYARQEFTVEDTGKLFTFELK